MTCFAGTFSEEMLVDLVSISKDAMIALDEDLFITSWNKGAEEMFGYRADEIIGKNLSVLVPKDLEQKGEVERIRKIVDTEGSVRDLETIRVAKDGRRIYVQVTATIVKDKEGRNIGLGIYRDITEKKEREKELLRQNKELSILKEIGWVASQSLSLKEVMDIVLAKVIKITEMDGGLIRLFDEDKKELVIAAHRGIPPEVVEYAERLKLKEGFAGAAALSRKPILVENVTTDPRTMEIAIKAGLKSVATIPLLSKDKLIGTLQMASYTFHSFHPRDKEFLAAIGNQIGIFIENAKLYDQLRFLASIPTNSPYGLFTIDNNRIITSWNKGAENIYGWKEEEVIGRSIRIIAPDDLAESQERNFENLIKEGILRAVEIERVRKDGGRVPVELTSWTIKDEEGKVIGYTGFFRDLTEEKKMQEELAKRQREIFQAEKLASIGSLAAGACHEILNPLNIISSYSQFLLPKYNLDPTLSNALKIIDEQCQRIEKITRGLTQFARKGEMRKELVDLKELILTTLALVEKGISLDNIKLIKRIEGPLILEADGDQLSQVILGVINNARDALHGKAGTIKISTDIVERNGTKEVLLTIADTGEGIEEEHLGKIFEPFFTTKPVGKGTGLGLSVAHGIIMDHGGSIEVESKVRKGTTFKIFLPLI